MYNKKSKFKVVVTGHVYNNLNIEEEMLKSINSYLVDANNFNRDELLNIVKNADALIVGDTIIDKQIIKNMKKCKIISEYGIGVDNIDLTAASECRIVVTNVPDYGTNEVADHAIALLLSIEKKICKLSYLVKTKGWSYARKRVKPIFRLEGKILGIIGFGRIGSAFANRAAPFGFKILVYDPYKNDNTIKKSGYISANLDRILKESDFISFHIPLCDETRSLINEEKFELMKKNAYIINTARGEILDENAFLKALKNKWIAGAAIDVLADYEPKHNNPLIEYSKKNNNLLIVPHTAWYSEESELDLRVGATKAVIDQLTGKKPRSQINIF